MDLKLNLRQPGFKWMRATIRLDFSLLAMVNDRGHEVERYTYDAYGLPVLHVVPVQDVNYDGSVGNGDLTALQINYGWDPFRVGPIFDLNGDGSITSADQNPLMFWWGLTLATSPRSSVGNPYLFTGRTTDQIDDDTDITLVLQDNRNRSYDLRHGRWLQRDPAGYVDGLNLYQYVRSGPVWGADPSGLAWKFQIPGKLIYSCNCGWIDYNHASPGKYQTLIGDIRAEGGQRSIAQYGFKVQHDGRFKTALGGKEVIVGDYFVSYGFSPSEQESVALGISMDMGEWVEFRQSQMPLLAAGSGVLGRRFAFESDWLLHGCEELQSGDD
jgi:RHS repeat-associated protein